MSAREDYPLLAWCGGRLVSHRCVDCGTNHESLRQWANRQIVEHRSRPTITPLSTVDHDFCDGCGQHTVVTDVWIDRIPTTLCQRCVMDALTAEGECLGRYWEVES